MIATDVLGPDMPTMGGLRDIIGTPEQDVPVDTLITDLVGQWPDATPDRDTLTDRDHAAWRILSPIQQNAPAPVEGHIYGLLGMLDHVEYLGRTGETGRMHAERALRFDPSDRFASAVLDTAPAADGERLRRRHRHAGGRHARGRPGALLRSGPGPYRVRSPR